MLLTNFLLLTSRQLTTSTNRDFVMFSDNWNDSMDSTLSSPKGRCGRRFSSDSSCRSVMTDDSDQASVFGDVNSPGPCSASSTTDDSCFFSRDFTSQDNFRRFSSSSGYHHQSLSRSSSSSLAGSSSSLSPSWEETRISSLFGTLPRKTRRASVRKHIFKLIPGLQRSVEEEETGTHTQWLDLFMVWPGCIKKCTLLCFHRFKGLIWTLWILCFCVWRHWEDRHCGTCPRGWWTFEMSLAHCLGSDLRHLSITKMLFL